MVAVRCIDHLSLSKVATLTDDVMYPERPEKPEGLQQPHNDRDDDDDADDLLDGPIHWDQSDQI
jgi:hypothetical protein